MGWWGREIYPCPQGKDRLQYMITEEGLNDEDETHRWEVVDAVLRGSTAYAAVKRTVKATGEFKIFAVVMLSSYGRDHYLMIKSMDESQGPYAYNCPKRIIERLTPTDSEYALRWRAACLDQKRKKNALGNLPIGTVIQLKNPQQSVLVIQKWRGRRSYIDPDWRHRATPKVIQSWGFDILSLPTN